MSGDMRPAKRILTDDSATGSLDAGVDLVADIVGRTMGPKGQSVALRLGGIGEGRAIVTKDGVFVANHIMVDDPEEDLGVQMAVEASRKTNDAAGDGTTGTVVLLGAMLREARQRSKKGVNPILMQKGMELEKDAALAELKAMSKPIDDDEEILNVALVSCQDAEIASKIAKIIQEVGKFGTVGVTSMTGPTGLDLKVQRGMYFDIGYEPRLTHLSAASVAGQLQRKGGNAGKLSWENDEVGVLLFDEPVRLWSDVAHIFAAAVEADRKKLLIFGDFMDDAALGLQAQLLGGIFTACTISRGNFGGDVGREILKDVAVFCGARFLSPADGTMPSKNAKLDVNAILGSCTAAVTRESFSLTQGNGTPEEKAARIALINELLEQGGLNEHEKQLYRERLARFTAGIGTVTVIAPTEVQQTSLRTRVDDAVCAVRSANEEGIVIGGGVALLRIHQKLDATAAERTKGEDKDIVAGREILRASLVEPVRKISEMAGEDTGERLSNLKSYGEDSPVGFNYWTGRNEDLLEGGIIDPTKVVRMVVENSVAVAGELLRVSATIVDMPKNETAEEHLTPRERAVRAHKQRMGAAK